MKIRTDLNNNYTYVSVDPKKENRHLIKCNKCGMILSKTEEQMLSFKHGKYCSSVAHAFIRKNHGEKIDKIFSSKFSSIKKKIAIDDGINYEDFLDYNYSLAC